MLLVTFYYTVGRERFFDEKKDFRLRVKRVLKKLAASAGDLEKAGSIFEDDITAANEQERKKLTAANFDPRVWEEPVVVKGYAIRGMTEDQKAAHRRGYTANFYGVLQALGLVAEIPQGAQSLTPERAQEWLTAAGEQRTAAEKRIQKDRGVDEETARDLVDDMIQDMGDLIQSMIRVRDMPVGGGSREAVTIEIRKDASAERVLRESSIGVIKGSGCFKPDGGHGEMPFVLSGEDNSLIAIASVNGKPVSTVGARVDG
jgi:hypothetical protein